MEITLLPGLLHNVHVSSVSLGYCQPPFPLDADGDHRSSDPEDTQQQRDGSTEGGQSGLAPAPAPYSFGLPHWPGQDRLTSEPSLQVVSQSFSRTITPSWVFLQALEANRFHVPVHRRIK